MRRPDTARPSEQQLVRELPPAGEALAPPVDPRVGDEARRAAQLKGGLCARAVARAIDEAGRRRERQSDGS
jgi:hypothetical protein